jgi:hypothetical protein
MLEAVFPILAAWLLVGAAFAAGYIMGARLHPREDDDGS